jgi:hypothetical protein
MLLNINTKTRFAEKRRTERLQSFGLNERGLRSIYVFHVAHIRKESASRRDSVVAGKVNHGGL